MTFVDLINIIASEKIRLARNTSVIAVSELPNDITCYFPDINYYYTLFVLTVSSFLPLFSTFFFLLLFPSCLLLPRCLLFPHPLLSLSTFSFFPFSSSLVYYSPISSSLSPHENNDTVIEVSSLHHFIGISCKLYFTSRTSSCVYSITLEYLLLYFSSNYI